ncbi:MAG: ComF family protein [Candidatus Pacebacteria bacterium]|nr:ComF family protein [Candidatus Paceibacterota bacterium]
MKLNNYFKKTWGIILNAFLPLDKNQKLLKNISVEKFLSLTTPAQIPPLKNSIAIFSYKNKFTRQAIWSLKFKNNSKISQLFGQITYDYLIEELSELNLLTNFDKPILISIPITSKKKRERGYNQTELIALEISKLDNNNSFEYRKNILKKIKNTLPQSRTRSKEERENNLKDCFKVIMPKLIHGRNIILLDDVITTGTTMNEAKKTLLKHNPKQIICVALAH